MTNPAAGGSFDIVIQEGGAVPTLLTVVSRAMLLTFADAEYVPANTGNVPGTTRCRHVAPYIALRPRHLARRRVPPGWNATQVATLDNERRTVQHLLSQLQYLTDVRVGELEAAIKSGLLPADPAQRTVNVRARWYHGMLPIRSTASYDVAQLLSYLCRRLVSLIPRKTRRHASLPPMQEANMVAVVNGALSALEVARRRLVDHWTALLMVPDPCP